MTVDFNTIVTGTVGIITAYLSYASVKDKKAQERRQKEDEEYRKKTDSRAELREKEAKLSMLLMGSNAEATLDLMSAFQENRFNGNLDRAKNNLEFATKAYREFEREQTAHVVAKQ